MRKKMIWVAGAVVGLVVLALGIAGGVRYFESRNAEPLMDPESESFVAENNGLTELIAEVQSEEEARELAELYGITLINVNGTLAVFGTEEDPMSVINRGVENGWKELSLNTVYYFNDAPEGQINRFVE